MEPLRSQQSGAIKVNKTCDHCRHRKIRCIVANQRPGLQPVCIHCEKRGQQCHFSIFRPKARMRVPPSLPPSNSTPNKAALNDLFIDRILQHGPQNVTLSDESTVFTTHEEQVPSSGLAFFSEQKVATLTQIIGNSSLRDAVKRLDDFILDRLGISTGSPSPKDHFHGHKCNKSVTPQEASAYIQAFFAHIHPVYPFLDQEEFKARVAHPKSAPNQPNEPVFSALYHSILALGSQFHQLGTFEPGKGKSWEFFEVALSFMKDIILPRESIESVQALAAMSIFAMNSCALQFDEHIISHAARMVVALRYHKNMECEAKHLRVFWVIYALEKQQSIHSRTCSIIPDEDIGCVVPPFPEAEYGGFNWFVALIKIGRIASIVSTSLFSISASLRTREQCQSTLDNINSILEQWRQSIPENLRPGDATHFPDSSTPSVRTAALQIHFSYYHIVIALERLTLFVKRKGDQQEQTSTQRLMGTARTILELTKQIDIQPHVPIFILAALPVSAVFILFDFVVHNPSHQESRTNLALLDTAAGYFSLMGIASSRALPGNILTEFAHIAREYFWRFQQEKAAEASVGPSVERAAAVTLEENNLDRQQQATETEEQSSHPESSSLKAKADLQLSTPTGSEYLEYPTPIDFAAASDFQTGDSTDLRTIFGWAIPDWYGGGGMEGLDVIGSTEMDMDAHNYETTTLDH